MKKLEELYAHSVLWTSGFDLFDSYNKWLDEEFLKTPDAPFLLELEELSSDKYKTHSFLHQHFMDNTDFDREHFSKTLFCELEKFYRAKDCDFDSFVNNCYVVWSKLPAQIQKDEEPFFTLDYAGVPIEWGDYTESRKILENAFRFFDEKDSEQNENENAAENEDESAEPKIRTFSEISSMENGVLTFRDGEKILLSDCAGKKWGKNCVGERDYFSTPPYFLFFTDGAPTKIIFTKSGFFAKRKNARDFNRLRKFVQAAGFSTMDLG